MKNATALSNFAYIYAVDGDICKLVTAHSRQYSSLSNARRAMRSKSSKFGNGYMKIVTSAKSLAYELKKETLQRLINSSSGF